MSVILTVHTEVEMPDSSIIDSVDYYANEKRLVVHFSGGRSWEYDEVPKEVVQAWTKAESCGSYFRENIREEYDNREVFGE